MLYWLLGGLSSRSSARADEIIRDKLDQVLGQSKWRATSISSKMVTFTLLEANFSLSSRLWILKSGGSIDYNFYLSDDFKVT